MTSGHIYVGGDEAADFGVVVAGGEIVEAGFGIVVVTAITERVVRAKCSCQGAGGGYQLAPRIVDIFYHTHAAFVHKAHYIILAVYKSRGSCLTAPAFGAHYALICTFSVYRDFFLYRGTAFHKVPAAHMYESHARPSSYTKAVMRPLPILSGHAAACCRLSGHMSAHALKDISAECHSKPQPHSQQIQKTDIPRSCGMDTFLLRRFHLHAGMCKSNAITES